MKLVFEPGFGIGQPLAQWGACSVRWEQRRRHKRRNYILDNVFQSSLRLPHETG